MVVLKSRVEEEQVFGAAAAVVVRSFATVAVLGINERLLKLVDSRTDANKKAIQHKCRDILGFDCCCKDFGS